MTLDKDYSNKLERFLFPDHIKCMGQFPLVKSLLGGNIIFGLYILCNDTNFGFVWKRLCLRIKANWRMYASVKQALVSSDNCLLFVRCQAIIWTNAGFVLS